MLRIIQFTAIVGLLAGALLAMSSSAVFAWDQKECDDWYRAHGTVHPDCKGLPTPTPSSTPSATPSRTPPPVPTKPPLPVLTPTASPTPPRPVVTPTPSPTPRTPIPSKTGSCGPECQETYLAR